MGASGTHLEEIEILSDAVEQRALESRDLLIGVDPRTGVSADDRVAADTIDTFTERFVNPAVRETLSDTLLNGENISLRRIRDGDGNIGNIEISARHPTLAESLATLKPGLEANEGNVKALVSSDNQKVTFSIDDSEYASEDEIATLYKDRMAFENKVHTFDASTSPATTIVFDTGQIVPTLSNAKLTFTMTGGDLPTQKETIFWREISGLKETALFHAFVTGGYLDLYGLQLSDTEHVRVGYTENNNELVFGSSGNTGLTRTLSLEIREDRRISTGPPSKTGSAWSFPYVQGLVEGAWSVADPSSGTVPQPHLPEGDLGESTDVVVAADGINKAIAFSESALIPYDRELRAFVNGVGSDILGVIENSNTLRALPPASVGDAPTGRNHITMGTVNGVAVYLFRDANYRPMWAVGTAGTYSVSLRTLAEHYVPKPTTSHVDHTMGSLLANTARSTLKWEDLDDNRLAFPATGKGLFYSAGNVLFEIDWASLREKTASVEDGGVGTDTAYFIKNRIGNIEYFVGRTSDNKVNITAISTTTSTLDDPFYFVITDKPGAETSGGVITPGEPANVAFDETITLSASNINKYVADSESSPIISDRPYDVFVNGEKEEDWTAEEIETLPTKVAGGTADDGTLGIVLSGVPAREVRFGETSDGHFVVGIYTDAADPTPLYGTTVQVKIQTQPIPPTINVDSMNFITYLVSALTGTHGVEGLSWNQTTGWQLRLSLGEIPNGLITATKFATSVQSLLNKITPIETKVNSVESWALNTSTDKVEIAKIPLPNITDVATYSGIPNPLPTSGVRYYRLTANDHPYKKGQVFALTDTGIVPLGSGAGNFTAGPTFPTDPTTDEFFYLTADVSQSYEDDRGHTSTDAKSESYFKWARDTSDNTYKWFLVSDGRRVATWATEGNLDVLDRVKLPPPVIQDDRDIDDVPVQNYRVGVIVDHQGDAYLYRGGQATQTRNEVTLRSYTSEVSNHAFRLYQDGQDAKLEFRVELSGIDDDWNGLSGAGARIQIGGAFVDSNSARRAFNRDGLNLKERFGYYYVTYTCARFTLPNIFPATLDFVDLGGDAINFLSPTVDSVISRKRILDTDDNAPPNPFPAQIQAEKTPANAVYDVSVNVRVPARIRPFSAYFPPYQTESHPGNEVDHHTTAYAQSAGTGAPRLPYSVRRITFYASDDSGTFGTHGSRINRFRFTEDFGYLRAFNPSSVTIQHAPPGGSPTTYNIIWVPDAGGIEHAWTATPVDPDKYIPDAGRILQFHFNNNSGDHWPEDPATSYYRKIPSTHFEPQVLKRWGNEHFRWWRATQPGGWGDNRWEAEDTTEEGLGNRTYLRLSDIPSKGYLGFRIGIPGRFKPRYTPLKVNCEDIHNLDRLGSFTDSGDINQSGLEPLPLIDLMGRSYQDVGETHRSVYVDVHPQLVGRWSPDSAGTGRWSWDHVSYWVDNSTLDAVWYPEGLWEILE